MKCHRRNQKTSSQSDSAMHYTKLLAALILPLATVASLWWLYIRKR